jgi:hypothetical protein
VKKELAIFKVEGKRGVDLECCYVNLNSIPPRSLDLERIFSGCGRTVTKIRSTLHDESRNMLTFLRGYFKTKNN